MQKDVYVYRLTDAKGDQSVTVVDDPSDNGCIGGYDINGVYQQYDSYELYYAYEWAESHGMKLESAVVKIDLTDDMFKK